MTSTGQNASEREGVDARALAQELARLQVEAAKLGVDLAPQLRALIAEWGRELARQRRE